MKYSSLNIIFLSNILYLTQYSLLQGVHIDHGVTLCCAQRYKHLLAQCVERNQTYHNSYDSLACIGTMPSAHTAKALSTM